MARLLHFSNKKGASYIARLETYLSESNFPSTLKYLELRVFGSVARGALNPSDLDLVVLYRESEYVAAQRFRRRLRCDATNIESAIGLRVNLLVLSTGEFDECAENIGPTVALFGDHFY